MAGIARTLVAVAVVWTGMASLSKAETTPSPLCVLVLSGQNNHDWKQTTPPLRKMLTDSKRFAVDVTDDPTTINPADLDRYDVIVSNWTNWPEHQNRIWPAPVEQAIQDFVAGGKGFALFHAAGTPFQNWPEYQQIVGSTWDLATTGHGAIHTFKVTIADRSHPITRGMGDFDIRDELWHRTRKQPNIQVLCKAFSSKESQGSGEFEVVAHCQPFGKGRCFNLVLGHDAETMQNPNWQALMLRGIEWAATGKVTLPAPPPTPGVSAAIDPTKVDFDAELKTAVKCEFGQPRAALLRVEAVVVSSPSRPEQHRQILDKLTAALTSAATVEGKKFLCRQIGLIGTAAQVPALAPLLADKDLSMAARSALQAIPGDEASTALRITLERSKGLDAAGLINTLGERRDKASVPAIARFLSEPDTIPAGAAIDALGKIADSESLDALTKAHPKLAGSLLSPWCDAMLKCAESLASSGNAAKAAAIYQTLCAADKPKHVRIAAFPRMIALKGGDAETQVVGALAGPDAVLRTAALRCVPTTGSPEQLKQSLQTLSKAVTTSHVVAARKDVLTCLGSLHTLDAMRFAMGYLKDTALGDAAASAVLDIAPALPASQRDATRSALKQLLAAGTSMQIQARVFAALLKVERPVNLAIGAKANSPDNLDKDNAAHGDQAAIDGNPRTYWDETDGQNFYCLRVTLKEPKDISAISILGYEHHQYAPKDFEIVCDDQVVQKVGGAVYHSNELVVVFPQTRCQTLELRITGYYGQSPAIRELGIYDVRDFLSK